MNFWKNFLELCNGVVKSPNAIAKEIGIPSGSITAWKNGTVPQTKTVNKIAEYFYVSVGTLLGYEEQKEKTPSNDEDVKVALFGGDGEVTDEMWEEVKKYAEFIKSKYNKP